jgi:TPR repeat protein
MACFRAFVSALLRSRSGPVSLGVAGGAIVSHCCNNGTNGNGKVQNGEVMNHGDNNILEKPHLFLLRLTREVSQCEALFAPPNMTSDPDTLKAQKLDISNEETRFELALDKHRRKLAYYEVKWQSDALSRTNSSSCCSWPQDIALPDEIPALKTEMRFCQRSPNYRDDTMYCQQVQFRIATALLQSPTVKIAAEGLAMVKDLAERGHPDGMCLYGICLCEGKAWLDPNPHQGVVWLRRCAELHGHAQAIYELGVAFYTGEGVVEDEGQAVKYFRMASDDGHPGASYLLGDCLLDGFGTEKDRAEALERFISAAERGHRGAQARVLEVLEHKPGEPSEWFIDTKRPQPPGSLLSINKHPELDGMTEEAIRLERRYTIGGEPGQTRRFYFGGPSPPAVIARRKTIVDDSRRT